MLKKYTITSMCIIFMLALSFAQDTTKKSTPPSLVFSGYLDVYGAMYSDSVGIGAFQKFPTVSPRSKQFGLNVALISAKYAADRVRGTVTLHYGDIPLSAWSGAYNFIEEANAGIRLGRKIWIDAGFFRSHLGTEGLFPKENIASSLAIHSCYQPYFESGVRLNYSPSKRLVLNLYVLNGFNLYEDNNTKKSLGVLATYAFSGNMNIGYSGYFGDDSPQGVNISHFRTHNNLFFNFKANKLKAQVGGDYSSQENFDFFSSVPFYKKHLVRAFMLSGVLSLKYQFTTIFSIYSRGEFFNDYEGFITGVYFDKMGNTSGLSLWGITGGIEIKPTENAYLRIEGRRLTMDKDQEIFWTNNKASNTRMEIMINMGVSFP